jgi:hypothetical protein
MIHGGNFNKKRRFMKKSAILAGLIIFLSSSYAFSDNIQIGLMAGADSVMAGVEFQAKKDPGLIAAGAAVDYTRDEYTIGEALVAFRRDQLLPGVKFGLGFKGYLGKVDAEDGGFRGTLSALSFLLEGAYEFPSSLNPLPVPVEAFGAVCFAPPSLSFDETESVQECKGGLRLFLLENACLSIECKYRVIEFDEQGMGEWERDDTILSAGVVLKF